MVAVYCYYTIIVWPHHRIKKNPVFCLHKHIYQRIKTCVMTLYINVVTSQYNALLKPYIYRGNILVFIATVQYVLSWHCWRDLTVWKIASQGQMLQACSLYSSKSNLVKILVVFQIKPEAKVESQCPIMNQCQIERHMHLLQARVNQKTKCNS